jgi:HrpA-like RNA helicase
VQQWQQQQQLPLLQQPGVAPGSALDPTVAAIEEAVAPASHANTARSHRGVVTWLHQLAWSLLIQVQKPTWAQWSALQGKSCAARVEHTVVQPQQQDAAQHQHNQQQQAQLTASSCLRQRLQKYMVAHAQWREQQARTCRPIAAAHTWAVLEHEEQVGSFRKEHSIQSIMSIISCQSIMSVLIRFCTAWGARNHANKCMCMQ